MPRRLRRRPAQLLNTAPVTPTAPTATAPAVPAAGAALKYRHEHRASNPATTHNALMMPWLGRLLQLQCTDYFTQ